MAYTGAKGGALYDPEIKPATELTKEEYVQQSKNGKGTAINHFYGTSFLFYLLSLISLEKLFKLKDLMRTESGKAVALERHCFMQAYVDQFVKEWNGEL